jgi:hypothetical protein
LISPAQPAFPGRLTPAAVAPDAAPLGAEAVARVAVWLHAAKPRTTGPKVKKLRNRLPRMLTSDVAEARYFRTPARVNYPLGSPAGASDERRLARATNR